MVIELQPLIGSPILLWEPVLISCFVSTISFNVDITQIMTSIGTTHMVDNTNKFVLEVLIIHLHLLLLLIFIGLLFLVFHHTTRVFVHDGHLCLHVNINFLFFIIVVLLDLVFLNLFDALSHVFPHIQSLSELHPFIVLNISKAVHVKANSLQVEYEGIGQLFDGGPLTELYFSLAFLATVV